MPNDEGADPQVALHGQDNFRDLGGHRAEDGRRVRRGQLFRSGELCRLSDEDVDRLSALGIRTVVDLRSKGEVERQGVDRIPVDASLISVTIDPGDLSPILGPAFGTGDFSAVPPDLLEQINRDYVREWRHQLDVLLRIVADPSRRPLVFHCTQGKDRAGIGAATVLSALGVPWESVIEDYLRSNAQRGKSAAAAMEHLRASAARQRKTDPQEVDMTSVRGLFFVDAAYIGAAHDEIRLIYGSVAGFIRKGIGWSDADLEGLRGQLLEQVPGER
jgi:protein-tyrosine phosphatase